MYTGNKKVEGRGEGWVGWWWSQGGAKYEKVPT